MQLADNVAIITGGASGIGRATALLFAREGAAVVIADVDTQAGQQAVSEIVQEGGKACFQSTDVTRTGDCRQVVERTLREFG